MLIYIVLGQVVVLRTLLNVGSSVKKSLEVSSMEKTTYMEVGKKAGLTGTTLLRYTYYMLARWADSEQEKCFFGYAEEWAERFKHKREYEASDHFGQGVLRQIDELSNMKERKYEKS